MLAISSWVRAMVKRISGLPLADARPQSSKQARQPPRRRAGERQPLGVVEDREVFAGERLRGVHAGDAVAAEEVDKLLLAHSLDLARLDGFGGHFVGNVGQNRAKAHHIAGAGDLENHGLAVAGGGRDFYLAEADNKDVARRVALGKQLGAAGMAHHDANAVVICKRLGCEIAEHPQMAMLTIKAIFRGVMGMK